MLQAVYEPFHEPVSENKLKFRIKSGDHATCFCVTNFQLNPDWARFGRTGPTLCIPVPVTFSLHWSHSYYISRYISRYISFWTRIPRSVPGRYLGRIDPMFQISRDLSVESGPKVSEAGPGSVRALRPNSISDFQYRPVLDFRSVGPVLRSNPASTRPGPITGDI